MMSCSYYNYICLDEKPTHKRRKIKIIRSHSWLDNERKIFFWCESVDDEMKLSEKKKYVINKRALNGKTYRQNISSKKCYLSLITHTTQQQLN